MIATCPQPRMEGETAMLRLLNELAFASNIQRIGILFFGEPWIPMKIEFWESENRQKKTFLGPACC